MTADQRESLVVALRRLISNVSIAFKVSRESAISIVVELISQGRV